MARRVMEWVGRADYMGGIPRKMVIGAVGSLSKAWVSFLNSTTVHNADTLLHLVRSRPNGLPLITVSNHMSTLDDPLLWGFKGFPSCDANLSRWVLAAEDICFKSSPLSYFFRLGKCEFLCLFWLSSECSCICVGGFVSDLVICAGKCIPITRGGGIYQEHMNEALERLSEGAWVNQLISCYC